MKSPYEKSQIAGRLVLFLIGKTPLNLEAAEIVVSSKTLKSTPNYPDVIPKQRVLKTDKKVIENQEVRFLVKAYLPDIVVVEASLDLEDLLVEPLLDLKDAIFIEGRHFLEEYRCDPEFDEEYSVYCVSDYQGDPETFLATSGEDIVIHLKNERVPLDEEAINSTLSFNLKYAKDDLTIVDWDGAFIFDPKGDFDSNIELLEIANLQLLKSRIVDHGLDRRLEKAVDLMRGKGKKMLFRSREIRSVIKEIIQLRTESILESEAIEKNIKLIGDWYSAKLYSLANKKFYIDEWLRSINKKLDVLEDVYTMASENFSISFSATLEFILIGGWFILLTGWFILFFLEVAK